MFSRGDAVVYKCKGLYKVEEIGTPEFLSGRKKTYYTLRSVRDAGDKAYIPTDDEQSIRKPVSREEAMDLIGRIKAIQTVPVKNEKFREQKYKNCISDYSPESWVKVLKTTYKRTKQRGSVASIDRKYQMILEHALYSEFSFVLGVPECDVPEFIEKYAQIREQAGLS